MRLTEQQLSQILARNPSLKIDENPAGAQRLPGAKRKPDHLPSLDSLPAPEIEGLGRPILRIISRRVRLLDADNYAEGCKALVDWIKKAGFIFDDSEEHVDLRYVQEPVKTRREETTFVEIIWPTESEGCS